ncbi:MAG: hypothetical protein DME85_08665 [Verrucomicrobia bacterium]|nr:MAG: hypothetical protein DME85_08665 [Verrucomicrobiota bacterium]
MILRNNLHAVSPQDTFFGSTHERLIVYGTRATMEFNAALGRYVIMPDHVHFFIRGDQNFVLANWVKGLKRAILQAFPDECRRSFW